jgi:hypothetical protein
MDTYMTNLVLDGNLLQNNEKKTARLGRSYYLLSISLKRQTKYHINRNSFDQE